MIRFRLTELLADKAFREGRRIEWQDVAEQAGIHRATISRMLNTRGYNASMSNLDALCKYFNCQLGDLALYVPDDTLESPVKKSFRGPSSASNRPGQVTEPLTKTSQALKAAKAVRSARKK